MSPRDAARAALATTADALAHLALEVDLDAVDRAAGIIHEAPFTITSGSGSSGFVAAKMSHSLCCIDKPAKFMPPNEAIHGGLGAVRDGDAVIVVSRGGKTAELLPIIDVCKRRGARLIGLTEKLDSHLTQASDCVIPLVITRESDPLNVMATTSNLVVGAVLDAVLASVMVLSDYQIDQFAVIHPGGAVGARLNGKD